MATDSASQTFLIKETAALMGTGLTSLKIASIKGFVVTAPESLLEYFQKENLPPKSLFV